MADYTDPEYLLWSSIRFALQQCRHKPPKTHDCTASDAYFSAVADKVMEQIRLSGWRIEPLIMQKKPPVQ